MVAAEVRELAERSQAAATEIDQLVDSSVSTVNQAGVILTQLVPDIQKNAEFVREISAASREQHTGVAQINRAMQQLDTITQQNSIGSEEVAATAEALAAQAEQFRSTIAFFKVSEKTEDSQ